MFSTHPAYKSDMVKIKTNTLQISQSLLALQLKPLVRARGHVDFVVLCLSNLANKQ